MEGCVCVLGAQAGLRGVGADIKRVRLQHSYHERGRLTLVFDAEHVERAHVSPDGDVRQLGRRKVVKWK